MKNIRHILLFSLLMLCAFVGRAQEDKRDAYLKQQTDSILGEPILLEEVVIDKNKIKAEEDAKKRFLILQRRVYRVYPYAKTASERLTALNKGMAALKTKKEQKKYFKIVEDYLTQEFSDQLKKLSRKDGQILIKLIHRQTGTSTYDLIKNLKSGWKAFWANSTAGFFDLDLKTKYDPMSVNEDYLIETILYRAFKAGKLQYQKSALPIDYDNVEDYWQTKLSKSQK